jgi:DNA-binding NarL/FixJ family response regulator
VIAVTKVLIVDDHKYMCDALTKDLEGTGDFTVVGATPAADLADLACERHSPDLVFLDVCTDGGASGLDALKIIRKRFPSIKVIVMSGYDEISHAPRAKEAGAHAFLYKSWGMETFVEVARGVMEGKTYHPEPKTIPMPEGEAPLTDREMEILRLICKAMTDKAIAAELSISENTVRFHKNNMTAKMGFKKVADLAIHMLSNGWINPRF